jgi:hypothetical protein
VLQGLQHGFDKLQKSVVALLTELCTCSWNCVCL